MLELQALSFKYSLGKNLIRSQHAIIIAHPALPICIIYLTRLSSHDLTMMLGALILSVTIIVLKSHKHSCSYHVAGNWHKRLLSATIAKPMHHLKVTKTLHTPMLDLARGHALRIEPSID